MLSVTEFSASLNAPGTDLGTRERILNVDGEVFHLKEPSFSIKYNFNILFFIANLSAQGELLWLVFVRRRASCGVRRA